MRPSLRWLAVFAILLTGWAAPLPLAQAGPAPRVAGAPNPPPGRPAPAAVPAQPAVDRPDCTGAHPTGLSPATVAANSPAFTLTLTGACFFNGVGVSWNSGLRATTFVSDTRLSAVIPASDVTAVGTFSITVTDGFNALTATVYLRHAHDTTADGVLGQPSFITNPANNPLMPAGNALNQPQRAVIDPHSGRLYVSDSGNHRVLSWPNAAAQANSQAPDLVFGQAGSFTTTQVLTVSAKSLRDPIGVALDPQGRLYVADCDDNRVLEYDTPLSSATANHVFGQSGSFTTTSHLPVTANSLDCPVGVTVDAAGRLYVADYYNNRVLEYNTPLTSATANRVLGQGGSFSATNYVTVTAGSLNYPAGLALDAAGRLYVADTYNDRVLEYDTPLTSATANRVFGQSGSFTNTADLPVTANSLSAPYDVGVDAIGNLYVADYDDNRVLEYDTPASHDTTADRVFGQNGHFNTTASGTVNRNTLNGPTGVALDALGNLFVVDYANHRALEFDQPVLRALFVPLVRR